MSVNRTNQLQPNETILEKYRVEQFLGYGMFGHVYLCEEIATDTGSPDEPKKMFAIKIYEKFMLKKSAELKLILKREVDILKELDNENICKYIEFGQDILNFYLVLEYCDLRSLDIYIKNYGQKITLESKEYHHLTVEMSIHIVIQVLKALTYLLTKKPDKIIHRDIKQENILLVSNKQEKPLVKLGDFGFSRKVAEEENANTFLGSPQSMAPEILQGKPYNEKADIYSLGVVFYQMLCGTFPYLVRYQMMASIECPEKLKFPESLNISTEIQQIIQKMLQIDPSDRIDHNSLMELLKSIDQSFAQTSKLDQVNLKFLDFEIENSQQPIEKVLQISVLGKERVSSKILEEFKLFAEKFLPSFKLNFQQSYVSKVQGQELNESSQFLRQSNFFIIFLDPEQDKEQMKQRHIEKIRQSNDKMTVLFIDQSGTSDGSLSTRKTSSDTSVVSHEIILEQNNLVKKIDESIMGVFRDFLTDISNNYNVKRNTPQINLTSKKQEKKTKQPGCC